MFCRNLEESLRFLMKHGMWFFLFLLCLILMLTCWSLLLLCVTGCGTLYYVIIYILYNFLCSLFLFISKFSMFPKSTHETFAQKLYQTYVKHKRFQKPKLSRTSFTICHYAGDVSRTFQNTLFPDLTFPQF